MLAFLCLIIGFILGYVLRGAPAAQGQAKIKSACGHHAAATPVFKGHAPN